MNKHLGKVILAVLYAAVASASPAMAQKKVSTDSVYNASTSLTSRLSDEKTALNGVSAPGDFKSNIEKARHGDVLSMRIVGACYLSGAGVAKDEAEAWRWYARGASNGDPESQYMLATFYRDGVHSKKDLHEAAYWFRKAAGNGHPLAQVQIGDMFADGVGVLPDKRIAAENYWRAAELGNAEGAYKFAFALMNGAGMSQDLPRALKYFKIAAAQNYKDAAQQAQQLEARGVKVAPSRTVAHKTTAKKKTVSASSTSKKSKKTDGKKSTKNKKKKSKRK